MPNYCFNKVEVTIPQSSNVNAADIMALVSDVPYDAEEFKYTQEDHEYFTFNKLIPMPEDLEYTLGFNSPCREADSDDPTSEEIFIEFSDHTKERVKGVVFDKGAIDVSKVTQFDLADVEASLELLTKLVEQYGTNDLGIIMQRLEETPVKAENAYVNGEGEVVMRTPNIVMTTHFKFTGAVLAYTNYVKHGYANWYAWRVLHWGTMWDATSPSYKTTEDPIAKTQIMTWYFDTAWAMPYTIMQAFASKVKEISIDIGIKISYFEPGAWYAGQVIYDAGATADEYTDINCEEDEDIVAISVNEFGFDKDAFIGEEGDENA